MKTIPDELLQILKQEWKPTVGDSAYEDIMADEARRNDPSYYHYANAGNDEPINALKGSEVRQIMKTGLLHGLVVQNADSVALNEHAEHALGDFCSEVYDAWRRLNERLAQIPR